MSKSGKSNSSKSKNKEQKQEPETTELENTGNYLRTLRLGKGLSIKDAAEATRISASNLNAIEDQNFSALPANTFTRGLLNIYANYLGADAKAVVGKFMEERGNSVLQKQRFDTRQPRHLLTPKRLAEPSHISSMTMAGILLLFIIVSFTAYCVYTSWNPFSFLMKKSGEIESILLDNILEENSAPVDPAGDQTLPFEEDPLTAIPPQPIDEGWEEPSPPPDAGADKTTELDE
ncbi:MAG: helix-turn-helix domain-containing protein [Desulfobulbaceae bacterium]|nr:helix-turn-helix domain-containing protein [Desulfobulbaceae bacterium]